MTQRILAAVIGLLVLIPALVWGGTTAVEIIIPIAIVISIGEYARMAHPDDHRVASGLLAVLIGLVYSTALYVGDRWIGVVSGLVVVLAMTITTFRPGPIETAADRAGRLLLGVGWLSAGYASLALLRRLDHGLAWVFLSLALAWMADTGGYFAGRFFGKTKLYEKISPKKTVEGYIGGLFGATAGVFVIRALALPELSVVDSLILGVVVGTLGVVGDLAESMLKRTFQVKDSGTIMPGHGGLLDRVDSVLFIAPALYAYAVFVKGA